jgi:hypothetical protein
MNYTILNYLISAILLWSIIGSIAILIVIVELNLNWAQSIVSIILCGPVVWVFSLFIFVFYLLVKELWCLCNEFWNWLGSL